MRKIGTYVLSCFCLSTLLKEGAAETVKLSDILAPIRAQKAVEVASPPSQESTGSELEEKKPQIEINRDEVLRKIEGVLRLSLSKNEYLSLSTRSKWQPVMVQDTEWDVVLMNSFTPDARGRWYASLLIEQDGELMYKGNLAIDVSHFKEVWQTQKRISRGEIPGATEIKPVMRDIYLERGNPVLAIEDLSEYELVRALPQGKLLTWDDLIERPSVRRGDLVNVVVVEGSLTVTMKARSMEDGLIGDTIALRNLKSHRELLGTVVGPEKVELKR